MTIQNSPIHSISVIGAGAWGTALARLLASKGLKVSLWAYEQEVVDTIRSTRENSTYLPHFSLPDSLQVTGDLAASVKETDLILLAVPSHAMQNIVEQLHPALKRPLPVTIATKGIQVDSLRLMSHVVEDSLPGSWKPFLTVLSGPSFALEVSQGKPTTILLAGVNPDLVLALQPVFMTPHFRVYAGGDIIGAQIGGALKNVMAIAAGIADGLELGFNTRAALITRGLAEMIRLGVAMGADVSTLYGLSGLGDLVLSCTGSLSRNYTVGLNLGRGSKLDTILSSTHTVAEGVRTTRAAMSLALHHDIDMPIVQGIHGVLFEGTDPLQAVNTLMTRSAKSETTFKGSSMRSREL
ncbi:MAG: NAD(P)-dependent glycerol-3-phosphate dehydrogenase [Nitrospirota bacterium]|nr:MAG: NAD(P)-dependent glycerol-3-phosphate dehydrogenase [Nitrospirota bacterium]